MTGCRSRVGDSAINQGGAYRYISKPWNDDELLLTIREAFEKYRQVKENIFLADYQAAEWELKNGL
jgi:DNA-binding NtrC family response regulator